MSTLNELKEKRGKIADQMKDMVANIKGDFSPEQDAKFNQLNDEFNSTDNQIKRIEKIDNAQNIANQGVQGARPPVSDSNAGANVPINATKEYKQSFWQYLSSGGAVRNDLYKGSDPNGGFLIPEDWARDLIVELDDEVVMRQVSTVETLRHDRNYPGVIDHGEATYIGEKEVYPESDITLNNKKHKAYKQGRIIKISDELEQDSAYNVPNQVRKSFQMTFGTGQEKAFTTGDGVDKPTGILTTASDGPLTIATGAVSHDDILNLKYSLKSTHRKRASWMANSNTIRDLRKLKDANGHPLWQPSMQAGEPEMIDGSVVWANEQMPDIGDGSTATTPLMFGDYGYYLIVDRLTIQWLILREKYADTGQIGMRITARNDGMLMLPTAVKTLRVQAR